MRFSSMIGRSSLRAKSKPSSHCRFEIGSIFSRHRSGKRPHSTVAFGEHRRSDHDEALHGSGAARQFTADFLRTKVLVGGQAEPSLVRDGDDRPRDFAWIFGPARARRPSPHRAFCHSHLSCDRGRADDGECGLNLALPIRGRSALTGPNLFGLRSRKSVTGIVAPDGRLLQDQPPFAVPSRAAAENAAGKRAAERAVGRQHLGDGVASIGRQKFTEGHEPPAHSVGVRPIEWQRVCRSRQIANRESPTSRGRARTAATTTACVGSGSLAFRPTALATRRKFQGRRPGRPLICRACAGLVTASWRTAGRSNRGRGSAGAHPTSHQLYAKLRRSSLRMAAATCRGSNSFRSRKSHPARERVALGRDEEAFAGAFHSKRRSWSRERSNGLRGSKSAAISSTSEYETACTGCAGPPS